MTTRFRLRLPTTARVAALALTSAALTLTLVGPTTAQAQPAARSASLPSRIALPDGFQPEGIAVRGPIAYLGSRTDGDIFAVDLRSGKGGVISQGPGKGFPSVGVKVGTTRLYVSGGNAGTGRIVDIRTGAILADHTFTAGPSFVNDVVLTKKQAWFTDSLQPQLYGVARVANAASAKVTTLKLRGDWKQEAEVNNANGIAQSPDKRSLLVIQSNTGFLFRVNPKTGVARRVDLGKTLLTNGDGLLLRGRTLYVVRNRLNQVAVVHLDTLGSRGRLVDTLTKADLPKGASFDVPTTAAYYRGNLYLPNARFGNAAPLTADYWVTRLPVAR